MLIKELIDNKSNVILYTRPRRFGKTLNISMLQYFFEKKIDLDGKEEDNAYLFKNTNIMDCSEDYLSYMGKYPVINLSLKSAKQPTFDLSYSCIKEEIISEFKRHINILNDNKILEEDKRKYMKI